MEHILRAINLCAKRENDDIENFCENCPYKKYDTEDSEMVCIDQLLLDAKTLIMEADRRMYNIQKMCTEWTMVKPRESILNETLLWDKAKGED